jgi:hypothetical protein
MLVCALLLVGSGIAAGQTRANDDPSCEPSSADKGLVADRGDFTSISSLSLLRRAPLEPTTSLAPRQAQDVVVMPRALTPAEFVVRDGMVFVRLLGLSYDVPMPGGGASGCFDPDGVQRGYAPGELMPFRGWCVLFGARPCHRAARVAVWRQRAF